MGRPGVESLSEKGLATGRCLQIAKEAVLGRFSTFLFAGSGFRTGAARVLDIGGQFSGYNYSPSPYAADAFALYADWRAVGDDLQAGVRAARRSDPKQLALFNNKRR